jgi:large subunit ribosomal protein L9
MLTEAESRKAKLAEASVTITAHASAEGKLFGSVGPRDIAEALVAVGHDVHKNEVILGEGPLRNTGEYDVVVNLHADVLTTVKVIVVSDKSDK